MQVHEYLWLLSSYGVAVTKPRPLDLVLGAACLYSAYKQERRRLESRYHLNFSTTFRRYIDMAPLLGSKAANMLVV